MTEASYKPYEFVRIGQRGINLALVTTWRADRYERHPGDSSGAAGSTVEGFDVLTVRYVGGETEEFVREEATALLRILEQRASDALNP